VKKRAGRKASILVTARDHVRGADTATVTLVGYGDFNEPECGETYRTVKKIQAKMGARLRYVFRSFPDSAAPGPAESSAEAGACAGAQGKFWEMHDALFENHGASDEVHLSRFATDVGLDLRQFRSEMRSHAHRAEVRAVRREGVRCGVTRVPAFFINSRRHRSAFGLATLLPAVQAAAGEE